jgi:hypothetical protein
MLRGAAGRQPVDHGRTGNHSANDPLDTRNKDRVSWEALWLLKSQAGRLEADLIPRPASEDPET